MRKFSISFSPSLKLLRLNRKPLVIYLQQNFFSQRAFFENLPAKLPQVLLDLIIHFQEPANHHEDVQGLFSEIPGLEHRNSFFFIAPIMLLEKCNERLAEKLLDELELFFVIDCKAPPKGRQPTLADFLAVFEKLQEKERIKQNEQATVNQYSNGGSLTYRLVMQHFATFRQN